MTAQPDWTTGAALLVYDECRSCGRCWALPRAGGPACGNPAPRRRAATGRGLLAAVTVVHPWSARSGEQPVEPYSLVLVDLDEGVRMMGRATPGLVVGARVRAEFADGVPIFVAGD